MHTPSKMAAWAILTAAILVSPGRLLSQKIDNADFSRGKAGWTGDGKLVYFDANGETSETQTPDSTPAIRIDLRKNKWTALKQRLTAKASDSGVSFSIEVMADPSFKPAAESREYTDIDFRQGGQYVWSAEVYPKAEFLIRLRDDTWYYRPFKLAAPGSWKKFTVTFDKLKYRQRELELLFPPGDGAVFIKGG